MSKTKEARPSDSGNGGSARGVPDKKGRGARASRKAPTKSASTDALTQFWEAVPKETIPKGYECDASGVRHVSSQDATVLASAPVGVSGSSRLEDGSGRRIHIVCIDMEGDLRTMEMARADLANPRQVVKQLLDRGLRVQQSAAKHISDYLSAFQPQRVMRLVTQPGWVGDPFKAPCFALGRKTIGSLPGGERVDFAPSGNTRVHEALRTRGDIDAWRKHVAERVRELPLLTFAVCAGLGAPLARLAGVESLGYHFHAETSRGKTTLLQVIASLFGRASATGGAPGSLVNSWNATRNAAELQAHASNDLPLLLDELKAGNAGDLGTLVYMLSQGQGKNRMAPGLSMSAQYRWRVTVFSTGEMPVRDALRAAGKQVHAGQEVRLVNIPLRNDDYGPEADDLVRELKGAVGHFYGSAGRAFLEAVVGGLADEDGPSLADFQAYLDDCANKLRGGLTLTPERDRVTNFFALALMAGYSAVSADILPFSKEEVLDAVKAVHSRWLESTKQLTETEKAVLELQEFVVARSSQFPRAEAAPKGRAQPRNPAGYLVTREHRGERQAYFAFFPKVFREVCGRAGADCKAVASWLCENDLLLPGEGNKLQGKVKAPDGNRLRAYLVSTRLTDLELEDDCQSDETGG